MNYTDIGLIEDLDETKIREFIKYFINADEATYSLSIVVCVKGMKERNDLDFVTLTPFLTLTKLVSAIELYLHILKHKKLRIDFYHWEILTGPCVFK